MEDWVASSNVFASFGIFMTNKMFGYGIKIKVKIAFFGYFTDATSFSIFKDRGEMIEGILNIIFRRKGD